MKRSLRSWLWRVPLDQEVDDKYAEWQSGPNKARREKLGSDFKKIDHKLQKSFPKFYYKQKVIEEMALVADNIHDKIQASLRVIEEMEKQRKSQRSVTERRRYSICLPKLSRKVVSTAGEFHWTGLFNVGSPAGKANTSVEVPCFRWITRGYYICAGAACNWKVAWQATQLFISWPSWFRLWVVSARSLASMAI